MLTSVPLPRIARAKCPISEPLSERTEEMADLVPIALGEGTILSGSRRDENPWHASSTEAPTAVELTRRSLAITQWDLIRPVVFAIGYRRIARHSTYGH